jgi:hypothetical protein
MRQFTYQALPMRIVFGAGSSIRLADRLPTSALTRVLVLCSPEQRDGDRIAAVLRGRGAGLLTEAQMHVPVGLAERARQLAAELRADGCVAMGGAADLPHSSQAFAQPAAAAITTAWQAPTCGFAHWPGQRTSDLLHKYQVSVPVLQAPDLAARRANFTHPCHDHRPDGRPHRAG